jgi:crossover junction endodeoxyribonuclease RuvC
MRVVRILGIDPGSRFTGYGCVDLIGNQMRLVTHGTLRVSVLEDQPGAAPLEKRLLAIHQGLAKIIQEFKPSVMAVERVFFAKNVSSALKLGQARGAVVLTGAVHGLEVAEYSASEVKAAVTGHGAADKAQVAKMLQLLVGAKDFDTPDASDGLALAICHAQRVAAQAVRSAPHVQAIRSASATGKKKKMSLAEAVGARAKLSGEGGEKSK